MGKMKLQVDLLENEDYYTSATLEEAKTALGKNVSRVVLTPFKTKCSNLEEKLAEEGDAEIFATPTQLLSQINNFKSTHILVEKGCLMADFGYLASLKELKEHNVSFILLEADKPMVFAPKAQVINLCKYFLKFHGDDRFVALFILAKIYPKITVISNNPKKIEIFSKIFKLTVVSETKDSYPGYAEVCVVMDEFIDTEAERIFYIGPTCGFLAPTKFDLKKAGKYVVRVRDVCKSLTYPVITGKRQINWARFANIDL